MGRMKAVPRPSPSGAVIFYGGHPIKKAKGGEGTPRRQDRYSSGSEDDESDPPGRASTSSEQTDVSHLSLADSGYRSSLSSDSYAPVVPGQALRDFGAIISLSKEIIVIFSNAPYVKVIAQMLLQIIQIAEEVQGNRERADELVQKIVLYAGVVFEALKSPHVRDGPGLDDLKGDLTQISKVLEASLATLQSIFDKSKTSRFTQVVRRGEYLGRIQELDRKLDTVITSFQIKSSIVLRSTAQAAPVQTMKVETSSLNSSPRPPPLVRLRSKPRIMFGRTEEITQRVDIILNQSPARIAILGPGGIGKTSLALSILHNEGIAAHFGANRLFLSCEAATSSTHILSDLAWALNLAVEGIQDRLLDAICERLSSGSYLVVLDNFETPWEANEARSEVEMLLQELDSINTLTLVITMRGSQHPTNVGWTKLWQPIQPVDVDSAMQIFQEICKQGDEHALKLVKAVDCVPLAVTLLANLAAVDGETTQALWKRWCSESTGMVESGSDRLSSVDFSIQLSLSSPRMKRDPDALKLLSVLALLPHGVSTELGKWLEQGIPGIAHPMKAISTLRQNSLVCPDSAGIVRLLSPIRLHVLVHHPPPKEARKALQDHIVDLAYKVSSEDIATIRERLHQEVGNIEPVLIDALEDKSPQRLEEVTQAILSYCHFTYLHGVTSTRALSLAIKKLEQYPPMASRPKATSPSVPVEQGKVRHAWRPRLGGLRFWKGVSTTKESVSLSPSSPPLSDQHLKLRADCLGCLGQLYARGSDYKKAKESLKAAKDLHMEAKDIVGQAYDIHNLACLLSRMWLDDTTISRWDTKGSKRCIQMFKEASQLHEQVGDKAGMAYDLLGLGNHLLQTPDETQPEAEEILLQAINHFREVQDYSGEASCLTALGHANLSFSAFAKAKEYFEKALALNLDDLVGKAENLAGLSMTYLLRSYFDEARRYIEEAMSIRSPIENPDHLHLLGRVCIAQYRYDEAEKTLQRSLDLHTQVNDVIGVADDRLYLNYANFYRGNLHFEDDESEESADGDWSDDEYYEGGDTDLAPFARIQVNYKANTLGYANASAAKGVMRLVAQGHIPDNLNTEGINRLCVTNQRAFDELEYGLRALASLGCRLGQAFTLHYLGCCNIRCSRFSKAEAQLQKALKLHEEVGNIQGQADDHNKLAEIAMREGSLQEALTRVTCNALPLHTKIGDIGGQGDDIYLQACIFLKQGRLDDADVAIRQALDIHRRAQLAYQIGLDLATLSSVLWQKYLAGDTSEVALHVEARCRLEEASLLFKRCYSRLEYVQCFHQLQELQKGTAAEGCLIMSFQTHKTSRPLHSHNFGGCPT